jgi:hypothetical protein
LLALLRSSFAPPRVGDGRFATCARKMTLSRTTDFAVARANPQADNAKLGQYHATVGFTYGLLLWTFLWYVDISFFSPSFASQQSCVKPRHPGYNVHYWNLCTRGSVFVQI